MSNIKKKCAKKGLKKHKLTKNKFINKKIISTHRKNARASHQQGSKG
tara:strand:- start:622 stop:762 length:141 start_codon:yes stop_codon:yes gene_type:complete